MPCKVKWEASVLAGSEATIAKLARGHVHGVGALQPGIDKHLR